MNNDKKNYYKLLEVEPKATEEELKKAYRRLAIKYHPDKNPGNATAEERFKAIAEAWSVLSNPETRRRYDQQGISSENDKVHLSADQVFAAFIASFFSAQHTSSSNSPPEVELDITHEFAVPLANLYHGKTSRFAVTRQEKCSTCDGRGFGQLNPDQLKTVACTACAGQRLVQTTSSSSNGGSFLVHMSSFGQCRQCSGSGVQSGHPLSCKVCSGKCYHLIEETVSIRIQPGSFDGQVLLINDKGNYSPASRTCGDLLLVIREKPDKLFIRKPEIAPQHLFLDIDISLADSLCGYACEIPHPAGEFIVSTKGIIEPNSLKVVRRRGMPILGRPGEFGDLILKYHVIFPKSLSKEQLSSLAAILPHKSNFKQLNWNLESVGTLNLQESELEELAPIQNPPQQCPIQ